MPPRLIPLTEGPSLMLDKPILLIGRHQECDIQIPSRKVSRRHCCIAQVNDWLVVRDLCSTNGIRINGSRVFEGKLHSGDELTIGNFRYEVSWNEAPDAIVGGRNGGVGDGPPQKPAPGLLSLNEHIGMDSCDEPVPIAESFSPDPPHDAKQSQKPTDLARDEDEPANGLPKIIPDQSEIASESIDDEEEHSKV